MIDEVERATDNQELVQSAELSNIRRNAAKIPAGEPGVCRSCKEDKPRLVKGRCASCRDNRHG